MKNSRREDAATQSLAAQGLDEMLRCLAGSSSREPDTSNILLPEPSLTPQNTALLMDAIGWQATVDEQQLIHLRSSAGWRFVMACHPFKFRLIMDWHLSSRKSLQEKLKFLNEQNMTLFGAHVCYLPPLHKLVPGDTSAIEPDLVYVQHDIVAAAGLSLRQLNACCRWFEHQSRNFAREAQKCGMLAPHYTVATSSHKEGRDVDAQFNLSRHQTEPQEKCSGPEGQTEPLHDHGERP
jgi:hypothetical protein